MADLEEVGIDYGFTLRSDEIAFLKLGPRCKTCDHLKALHNGHCCEFCLVCCEISTGLLIGKFPEVQLDGKGKTCTEGPGF